MDERIRTPDQRLRVFVSSTLAELAEERVAARNAIEQLRLAPVMFELGARPHPPVRWTARTSSSRTSSSASTGSATGESRPTWRSPGWRDEFRHVTAAAPVVAELLQRCPRLSVLVTSRTVLHLRGEQEWPVPPLALPAADAGDGLDDVPAVQLFVEHGRDARPSFALTRDNAAAVLELCRRLDGLPLAIELVAPRLKMLTPQQILERVGQQLDLTGALADLPERQRTLRATLDWSHDLLAHNARRLFARLSVFTGPFTFDAAERVCGWDDVDVMETLSTLVDHSLVSVAERADGEPAFRMLETVRTYAAARLEPSGELDTAYERLQDYLVDVFRTTAPRLHTEEQAVALRRLDAELGNFTAVFGWSIATGRSFGPLLAAVSAAWVFWQVRGHFRRMPELLPLIQQSPAAAVMSDADWAAVYFAHAGNLFTRRPVRRGRRVRPPGDRSCAPRA